MKPRTYSLLHPLLIASLFLLLLNDFYLKYAFHNWLTGKLSDFAGLFAFAFFLIVIVPHYRKAVLIFCALFFCWWKSSLSSPAIEFVNDYLPIPVHRVIDYSDLLALSVLPAVFYLRSATYRHSPVRSLAVYLSGIVCICSFCASSLPARSLLYRPYRENEVSINVTFRTEYTKQEVLDLLNPGKSEYRRDSMKYYKIVEQGDFYQKVIVPGDSTVKWVRVANNTDTTLFVKQRHGDFYILPMYLIEGDTLFNMEFRVYSWGTKRKPTGFTIESFQTRNKYFFSYSYNGKLPKHYKRHFKKLLEK